MVFENQNISQLKSFEKSDCEFLKSNFENIVLNFEKSKLNYLFSNWLDTYYFLTKNKHLLNNIDLNSKNDFNLFHIVEENFVIKKNCSKAVKFVKFKKTLGYLYLMLSNKIYLPGSDSLTSKIKFKASQFAIIYLVDFVDINLDAEIRFRKIISSLNVDSDDKNILLKLLPSDFFLNLKKNSPRQDFFLIGSPISLRNSNLIKLLAFGNKVKLLGIQHGCNYGIYKCNEIERFERDISDKYFLWLFSSNCVKISRYKNLNLSICNKNRKGLYWIGRPVISKYFSEQIPSLISLSYKDDLKIIESIYSIINQFEFKLIPHIHKESNGFYKIVNNSFFFRPNQNLEPYLLINARILIFDSINSSLIFFAIASNIPFLILSDNLENHDKGDFFDSFISLMKSMKSIYFFHESDLFDNELNQLVNDKKYYYERMILINSIRNQIYRASIKI